MTSSPELSIEDLLSKLINRGYRFVHPRNADGEVVAVVGVRALDTVTDVVRINAEDDVIATRTPSQEENVLEPHTVLWRCHGDLGTVVAAVLALDDNAETQHHAVSTSGCWVAGGRGRTKWLAATA